MHFPIGYFSVHHSVAVKAYSDAEYENAYLKHTYSCFDNHPGKSVVLSYFSSDSMLS